MRDDYHKYQTANAEPIVSHMLESSRAVGYTMDTAIADILDNSISAGAKNIWLDFDWKGSDTIISIKDDGCGMDNEELIDAMRLGSKDPQEQRDCKDLGRFGLGLKTASFSQCREYTVISKKRNNTPCYWTWDLDYIYYHAKKWQLIATLPAGNWFEQLEDLPSGTIVIWQNLDRFLNGILTDCKSYDKFLSAMHQVKGHIATVFHRYIESNKIKIYFNNREVKAWDPFMISHNATQSFPEEPLINREMVHGFVLPHESKLTPEEYKLGDGARGWNEHQGFYVYRNERMLVNGNWLGLFKKETSYKLARIRIDLPNTLDNEWQIDIKKSTARISARAKNQLKAYASTVRAHALEINRHRGKVISPKSVSLNFESVWIEKQKDGKKYYEINRKHPLIATMDMKALGPLMRLLEETLPAPSMVVINDSESPDFFFRPFERTAPKELINLMQITYNSLLIKSTPDQAKSTLLLTEPFNEYPELITRL